MFEFSLPDVGEGVAEGELVAWHVEPGEAVAEDDVLAEVETDKAVVELPSPVAGTVTERHAEPGDVVPVGEVLITIDPEDDVDANVDEVSVDDPVAKAATSAGESAGSPNEANEPELKPAIVRRSSDEPADGEGVAVDVPAADDPSTDGTDGRATGRVFAPPHARRLARELGVDLDGLAGSGPGGRVTATDVRQAAGAGGAADEDVADAIPDVESTADAGATTGQSGQGEGSEGPAGGAHPSDTVRKTPREGAEPETAAIAAPDRDRTLAAPATRRLAAELGVDLDAVPTETTRDGEAFVEPADVRAYADAQEAAQAADAAAMAESAAGEPAQATGASEPAGGERETREPYRGVRRTIGEQMAQSATEIPHATHHDTAVVTSLVEAREAMQSRAADRGIRLTYVPFVLKAVVAGLRDHPALNTSLDEDSEEIVYKHYYDVGVATATEAGLMVPVVRDVDDQDVLELAASVSELTEKARERSITREEMQGGTFTITNFGAIGGEYATPIINHPETAILGLGSIEQRPVVVDGEVEARHTLPLSLSIDHRVIDGADAARFVNTVVEYLETPSLLLLE